MRVRRSLLNFGTTILFTVLTMGVALVATPLLVRWLGSDRFGGARIVSDGYGYLTLLELGLSGAIAPLMARAIARGDEPALKATVAAGTRAYLRVSIVTVLVGLALTPLVPRLARGLGEGAVFDLQVAWVVGLAAFLSLALLPMRSLVEARQRGYLVNLLLTAQSLLVTGTSLFLARAGWGITGQSVALVVGSWFFNGTVALGVLWSHPGLLRAVLSVPTDPETRRALRGLSLPTLLLNLSGRLSILTDNLVVGGLLGASRVTSLYNTQRLASLGQTVLQGIGGATWAALAELHARGDLHTFNRRLIELSRLVAVLAAAGLAPVVAYNRAFVSLWLGLDGPDFTYGGDLVIAVAAVNVVLLAEQSLWAWCFSAVGNVRYVVAPAVAAAVVNFTASIFLTSRLGLVGPLLGTTIGCTTVGLWALPWLLHRVFGTSLAELAKAVGPPVAWGAIAATGLHMVTRFHQPRGWLGLALEMSLSGLAVLAVGMLAFSTAEDRKMLRMFLLKTS